MSDPSQVGRRVDKERKDAQVWVQHAEIHRKFLLRRQFLRFAPPGFCYVPFCGDGDIAHEMYRDRPILAADIEPERVRTFMERIGGRGSALWTVAKPGDCDRWPFEPSVLDSIRGAGWQCAILDLDAYGYPFDAWRAAVANLPLADTFVVFFTDSQPNTIQRNGVWREPDGTKRDIRLTSDGGNRHRSFDLAVMRKEYQGWWSRRVRPWLDDEAKRIGYRVRSARSYKRKNTLYEAAVFTRV